MHKPFAMPLIVAVLSSIFFGWAPVVADDVAGASREDRLKAAFVYNFAKFVTWPTPKVDASPSEPVVVGLFGGQTADDSLAVAMRTIAGKKIGERSIAIRIIQNSADILDCHILFITDAPHKTIHEALAVTAGQPVLTVSDQADFAEQGGMIQLIRVDNRLRFIINRNTATLSSLRISSQLLKLARKVVE